ncbi:phosphate ABC transporter permease PstA [Pseudomonadales bacterium]|nr:phosphate ABC transporter permease PstA [Pseudomonadales bacterium]
MNTQAQRLKKRHQISAAFKLFCLSVTCLAVAILGILILEVTLLGLPWLNFDFLTRFPSRFPGKAGILAGLAGTLWLVTLTAAIAIPIGVLAAVYLEEYAKPGRVSTFITINIANLAGVPSIVYGIIGLAIFVRFFGLDRSVLAGAMTMSLLILPVIIIASREAIKAVPSSLRQVAFALGATRWQVTRDHVLPQAMPGILTGVILALSRAIGETAPLIMIGALTYIAFVPEGPMDEFTALPIQIYNWTSRPQEAFHELASAGTIVLLLVLLIMNATAVWIRYRGSKNKFM